MSLSPNFHTKHFPELLAATILEPSNETVMDLTDVSPSGTYHYIKGQFAHTSSLLHAFAVRSQTLMLPLASPEISSACGSE